MHKAQMYLEGQTRILKVTANEGYFSLSHLPLKCNGCGGQSPNGLICLILTFFEPDLRLSATSMDAVPQAHLQDLLTTAVLLIGASAAAIVLSRRVGLGSVLGLIVVGVIIGPYTPGPLNEIAPAGGRTK